MSGSLDHYAHAPSPWKGQVWLTAILIAVCLVLILPVFALVVTAMGDNRDLMQHLIDTVLFRYISNTMILIAGVGTLTLAIGVTTAWLVSRYEFPFRHSLSWMLLLPMAMPSYIIAYVYTGFLDYAGPVQSLIREQYGFTSWNQYWFPEIRSMGGAIFVMGLVLYPYVYLMARTGFGQIPIRVFEATLLTGRSLIWHVGLPMGRPAIIAGLALVLMEVVADFGTVEFFAVETISLGVYNVWLGMNSITTAAQLALIAFVLVFILLGSERYGRNKNRFANTRSGITGVPRAEAEGMWRVLLPLICLAPIVLGFILPVVILVNFSIGQGFGHMSEITTAVFQTLLIAAIAMVVIMASALIIGIISCYVPSRLGRILSGLSATGYAFPGTVLALGVLAAISYVDQGWRWIGLMVFDATWAPLFGGSMVMLILAYMVRFQAVGLGAVQSALDGMPSSLVPASRVMGHGFVISIRRVVLPLIRPAVLAGGLLVFVDIMKELPMTLLLRPFDFNTLATITYQYAHDELIEQAALPALMIVLTGLLPVIIIQLYFKPRQ